MLLFLKAQFANDGKMVLRTMEEALSKSMHSECHHPTLTDLETKGTLWKMEDKFLEDPRLMIIGELR